MQLGLGSPPRRSDGVVGPPGHLQGGQSSSGPVVRSPLIECQPLDRARGNVEPEAPFVTRPAILLVRRRSSGRLPDRVKEGLLRNLPKRNDMRPQLAKDGPTTLARQADNSGRWMVLDQ
jgi:hypothetical protein